MEKPFVFKVFSVFQDKAALKVGTDGCLLGAWAKHPSPARILDIGSGTGIISLMLAQRYPQAILTAIDISESATEQSQINFDLSPFRSRMRTLAIKLQDFKPSEAFDLIVSNPPYFTNAYRSGNDEKDLARHDDSLPLDELFRYSAPFLNDQGRVAIVLPAEKGDEAVWQASLQGLYLCRKCEVYPRMGKEAVRVLLEFGKDPEVAAKLESLIIERNQPLEYSLDYWRLMKDFYLDF